MQLNILIASLFLGLSLAQPISSTQIERRDVESTGSLVGISEKKQGFDSRLHTLPPEDGEGTKVKGPGGGLPGETISADYDGENLLSNPNWNHR
ncbi:hypothetical protein XA68_14222 [Ophiocordyceps unilateralis]|uniref:Uncharacterized protein n=1 Tax=Ophiocordyceps unilateralis TaxID=268505 RepID=A0A2A9PAU9_OPHUN|nr:hypothetical protein XA68_14222 [Ophiocordyceps unilateralis]